MPTYYNPQECLDKLKAIGRPPCPIEEGTGGAYHCDQVDERSPWHPVLCEKGPYTPVQYVEAYNTKLCQPDEYNIVKCEEKTFANINDLIAFLKDHPDFGARPCYCCC